jgi:PEGA domain-containing protein
MKTFAALLMVVAVQNLSAQSVQKPHAPARSAPSTQHVSQSSAPAPVPSPFLAGPSTYAPHYTSPSPDRPRQFDGFSPIVFGYGYASSDSAIGPHAGSYSGPVFGSGSLSLDVEPDTAQVYVDGFYIWTVDDFKRTGVTLPTGPHRIELRASGYEALTIDVNIVAGQPTRYHGALPVERKPAANAVPPRARGAMLTMFVIPGCYAGDRPPRESALPQGCDIAHLHILTDPDGP